MAKARTKSEEQNAIDMLLEDHKQVQKMFKDFEKLDREDTEACQELVTTACIALKVHSMLEKELFYPAVRDQVDKEEDEDLLNEAEVEHQTVDQLIETIEGMDPGDAMYAAHFTVLSEYVKHHVQEEEKEMFPRVKKLKSLDLEALGEEMKARKQELMAEFGGEEDAELQEVDEDEEVSDSAEEEEAGEEKGSGRQSRTRR
ncbi:MAG TPA: hemerythrin domain-containing protein [Burkholderiales bacterium]|nr:hemerythrin domain-containing protein [Burkholderiales bacterium]